MGISDIAAVAAAVIAVVAAVISWRIYVNQRYQAHLMLVLELHRDLTSGEVAAARHVLGTLVYGDEGVRSEVQTDDALRAYFTLLWCFERIRAGNRTLLASSRALRRNPPKENSPTRMLYELVH